MSGLRAPLAKKILPFAPPGAQLTKSRTVNGTPCYLAWTLLKDPVVVKLPRLALPLRRSKYTPHQGGGQYKK